MEDPHLSTETATVTTTTPNHQLPRSSSPTHSPSSPTAATSPSSAPRMDAAYYSHSPIHHPADASDEDDLFVTDSPPHSARHSHMNMTDLLSDVPALRRTHVANGYREGLTAAKEMSLQVGFDVGFPDGAAVGARVGWVLGVLMGLERGNGEQMEKVLKAVTEGLGIREVVEVIEERGEKEEEGEMGDSEDKLTMEDVRVKDGLLENWYEGTRRVLGGAVVG